MNIVSTTLWDFYTFEEDFKAKPQTPYPEPTASFRSGLSVVVGPNGAGKTALALEAISWCLWGKTVRGVSPKKADVHVRFQADGVEYRAHREKGGSKTALTLSKFGTDKKGPWEQPINGQTPTETQAKIVALVGTWERFCAERVFGNRLRKKFGTATDKERKALLESILNLEVYERAAKLARADLTALQGEIAEYRTREAQFEGSAPVLREAYLEAKRLAQASWEREEARRALELDYEALEGMVAEWDKEVRGLSERRSAVQVSLDKVRHGARLILDDSKRDGAEVRRLIEEKGEVLSRSECPVCHTAKDSLDVGRIEAHYLSLGVRFDEANQARSKRLKVMEAEATELMEDRDAINAKLGEAEISHEAAKKTLTEKGGQLTLMNRQRKDLEDARVKEADLKAQLEDTERKYAELRGQRVDKENKVAEISCAVEVLGSKGARVLQMEGALSRASIEANRVLARLPRVDVDETVTVELTARRQGAGGREVDEVGISVCGAGDGEYEALSDGEQTRVDIALMLGLARAGGGSGYLVLDELFDALDELGVDAAAELVEELARNRQVVLISHNPRFLDRLPGGARWSVSRRGGRSQVEGAA